MADIDELAATFEQMIAAINRCDANAYLGPFGMTRLLPFRLSRLLP